MCDKIRLGLTRNRLFEFCNCVCFVGTIKGCFDEGELKKALKMLSLKYPIISSKTELTESNGEAYVVLNSVDCEIEFVDTLCEEFVFGKVNDGIDFTRKNFEFYVVNKNILCIFAHTTVADNYFLLTLAADMMSFYNKNSVSSEPCTPFLFSELSSIPVKAFTPVTDKLASELEVKWSQKSKGFGVDDYKKARKSFCDAEGAECSIKTSLDSSVLDKLKAFCEENKMDLSLVVAFCYYDALCKNNVSDKKHKKIYFQTNRRSMLSDSYEYIQGAHNGLIELFTERKNKTKTFDVRLIDFCRRGYKSFCSVSNNFEKDFFLMNLSSSFCDSAYMNKSGLYKSRISRKLSENHLCGVGEAGEFAFVNYSQAYWDGLRCFDEIFSSEPLKPRSMTFLQFDYDESEARLVLKYRDKSMDCKKAESVLNDVKNNIEKVVL